MRRVHLPMALLVDLSSVTKAGSLAHQQQPPQAQPWLHQAPGLGWPPHDPWPVLVMVEMDVAEVLTVDLLGRG